MNTPAIMLTAGYLIGLLGGIVLFIAPFTRRCRADMGWGTHRALARRARNRCLEFTGDHHAVLAPAL
jgi:hypothetical protein